MQSLDTASSRETAEVRDMSGRGPPQARTRPSHGHPLSLNAHDMANVASSASHGQRVSAVVKWLYRLHDDTTPSNRESCLRDAVPAPHWERGR